MEKVKRVRFLFDVDAWLSSTAIAAMSADQERAYLRLLLHAWKQPDCGLPNDEEMLAGLSLLGDRWATVGGRVRAQFVERGGRLYNERLLEEWGYQQEFHAKATDKAKAASTARWARREPDGKVANASSYTPSIPQAMPERCLRDPIANSEKRIAAKAAANTREREDSPPLDEPDLAQLAEAMHVTMGTAESPPDRAMVRRVLAAAGSLSTALDVCHLLRRRRRAPESYALFEAVARSPPMPKRPSGEPGVLQMRSAPSCLQCQGHGEIFPDFGLAPAEVKARGNGAVMDWVAERRVICTCSAAIPGRERVGLMAQAQ